MNPQLIEALARAQLREVRRQALRGRTRHPAAPSPGRGYRRPRLRSRAGFLLVEAGFRLLAATEPASRD